MALFLVPGRSWRYLGSSWPPRLLQDAQDPLQDASKTPKIPSKTPKIPFKTLPRPPKTPPRGLKTPPRRPRSPPRRLQGRPRGFQMPPRRPRSLPRPSRRPPKFSRCLQDAQYRFQDRPKGSEAVSRAYLFARVMPITASFLPSPCQVHKYSRNVLSTIAKSTTADCQGHGC